MNKDELIRYLRSLPAGAQALVSDHINGKIPEDVFLWRVAKYFEKSEDYETMLKNFGYKDMGNHNFSKDPEAVRTHEMLRDIVLSITGAIGGTALSKAIDKENSRVVDPVNYNLGEDNDDTQALIDKVTKEIQQSQNGGINFNFGDLFKGMSGSLTGLISELGSSVLNMHNTRALINEQNAYNTPVEQMRRFQEAGLNPNLVYGMGTNGNQPASGSPAPVDFATAQREGKMQMLAYQSDLAQKQANINLLDKQALEADQRAQGQSLQNQITASSLSTQVEIFRQQYRNMVRQNEQMQANARKEKAEARNTEIRNRWENELLGLEKQQRELEKSYQDIMNQWQPWLYSLDLFHKGATGIGALGMGIGSFGKLFSKAGKLPQGMSPQEFGTLFGSDFNLTY